MRPIQRGAERCCIASVRGFVQQIKDIYGSGHGVMQQDKPLLCVRGVYPQSER